MILVRAQPDLAFVGRCQLRKLGESFAWDENVHPFLGRAGSQILPLDVGQAVSVRRYHLGPGLVEHELRTGERVPRLLQSDGEYRPVNERLEDGGGKFYGGGFEAGDFGETFPVNACDAKVRALALDGRPVVLLFPKTRGGVGQHACDV